MKTTLGTVFVIMVSLLGTHAARASPAVAPGASQQEINKAVARRVFEEIFNQGKFPVADEIYARDFVNHGLKRDIPLEEDKEAARFEKTALPDLHMTVNLLVAEGDLVTVVWTMHGTHTRTVGRIPATGAKLELRGITVWRIVDGKIREEWTAFDQLRAVQQLVAQLKWPLTGLLCVLVISVWALAKFVRKLWLKY